MTCIGCDPTNPPETTYGMCLHCGSVEVALIEGVAGYRDLSDIGEHERYPVGWICEVCA